MKHNTPIHAAALTCLLLLTSCDAGQPRQKRGGDTRWMKYATVGSKPAREFALPSQGIFSLVFARSLDGKRALYSTKQTHQGKQGIHLIDFNTGKHIRTIPSGPVQCLAFSHAGDKAVSGGKEGVLRLWSLSEGKEIAHANGHADYMRAVACSPTASQAASGGEKGTILLWDIEEMKVLKRLTGHTSAIRHNCLVWSPDGKSILSGSWDGSLRLWDVESGKELANLNPGYGRVVSIALSPDGKLALSSYLNGPDNPCILWDLQTKKELHRFGIPGNVWHTSIPGRPWYEHQQLNVESVAFSPDGKNALFGIVFGSVIVWDINRWQQVALNRIHNKELGFVMYSTDGNSSISIGCDQDTVKESAKLKVWKLTEGTTTTEEEREEF